MLLFVLMTHAAVRHWWQVLPDWMFFTQHMKACLRCFFSRVLAWKAL